MTLNLKRFLQPSGSGRAISQDTILDLGWRHAFGTKLDGSLSVRVYRCDFQAPVVRDDWITSPTVRLACRVNPHWTMEVSCAWDHATSNVPDTPGREFDRTLFAVSVRHFAR